MEADEFIDPNPELSLTRPTVVKEVQESLRRAFGRTLDDETYEVIEESEYNQQVRSNMRANCNRVSAIVGQHIPGYISQISVIGSNPEIYYGNGGTSYEIASGHVNAPHRFVIDLEGKVWDPTTDNWGTKTHHEFLAQLEYMRAEEIRDEIVGPTSYSQEASPIENQPQETPNQSNAGFSSLTSVPHYDFGPGDESLERDVYPKLYAELDHGKQPHEIAAGLKQESPRLDFDPESRDFRIHYPGFGVEVKGNLYTNNDGGTGLWTSTLHVPRALREMGLGTTLYEHLNRWAATKGVIERSGYVTSLPAFKLREKSSVGEELQLYDSEGNELTYAHAIRHLQQGRGVHAITKTGNVSEAKPQSQESARDLAEYSKPELLRHLQSVLQTGTPEEIKSIMQEVLERGGARDSAYTALLERAVAQGAELIHPFGVSMGKIVKPGELAEGAKRDRIWERKRAAEKEKPSKIKGFASRVMPKTFAPNSSGSSSTAQAFAFRSPLKPGHYEEKPLPATPASTEESYSPVPAGMFRGENGTLFIDPIAVAAQYASSTYRTLNEWRDGPSEMPAIADTSDDAGGFRIPGINAPIIPPEELERRAAEPGPFSFLNTRIETGEDSPDTSRSTPPNQNTSSPSDIDSRPVYQKASPTEDDSSGPFDWFFKGHPNLRENTEDWNPFDLSYWGVRKPQASEAKEGEIRESTVSSKAPFRANDESLVARNVSSVDKSEKLAPEAKSADTKNSKANSMGKPMPTQGVAPGMSGHFHKGRELTQAEWVESQRLVREAKGQAGGRFSLKGHLSRSNTRSASSPSSSDTFSGAGVVSEPLTVTSVPIKQASEVGSKDFQIDLPNLTGTSKVTETPEPAPPTWSVSDKVSLAQQAYQTMNDLGEAGTLDNVGFAAEAQSALTSYFHNYQSHAPEPMTDAEAANLQAFLDEASGEQTN